MHGQAYEYVVRAVRDTAAWSGTRVVEFGSADVNGSVRPLFDGAEYHGIDLRPGNGVDEIADAASWEGGRSYDVVVCTETLEHAPDPAAIIRQAGRALKPGGVLIATMAAPERPPHDCNGDPLHDDREHYRGIPPEELRDWLSGWDVLSLVHDPEAGDVYVTAFAPARKPRRKVA